MSLTLLRNVADTTIPGYMPIPRKGDLISGGKVLSCLPGIAMSCPCPLSCSDRHNNFPAKDTHMVRVRQMVAYSQAQFRFTVRKVDHGYACTPHKLTPSHLIHLPCKKASLPSSSDDAWYVSTYKQLPLKDKANES